MNSRDDEPLVYGILEESPKQALAQQSQFFKPPSSSTPPSPLQQQAAAINNLINEQQPLLNELLEKINKKISTFADIDTRKLLTQTFNSNLENINVLQQKIWDGIIEDTKICCGCCCGLTCLGTLATAGLMWVTSLFMPGVSTSSFVLTGAKYGAAISASAALLANSYLFLQEYYQFISLYNLISKPKEIEAKLPLLHAKLKRISESEQAVPTPEEKTPSGSDIHRVLL